MTVNTSPSAISGTFGICNGGTTTFTATPAGNTWSSANVTIATIGGGSGIATGISAGTVTIICTAVNGCTSTGVLTVNPIPFIGGPSSICIGYPGTLSGIPMGGSWISANPTVATIDIMTGVVAGGSPGTTTISYTSAAGCSAIRVMTVNNSVAPITGISSVCVGLTTTLNTTTTGGTWTSSNTSVATVGTSSGIVTGVANGTAIISYFISSGCSASVVVTVNSTPGSITGTATVCAGSTTTLNPTGGAGGTWTSGATSIATVGTNGVVYGVATGTAGITYTAGVCGTASRVVTVTSSCSGTPSPGAVSASSSIVCFGLPLTLDLPTYTAACGHVKQWQYSSDGSVWSDLPGATSVPYTYNPTSSYYYRCRITCASSGLSATSGPIYVLVNYSIGSSTVIDTATTSCLPSHFYVTACGVSSMFNLITFFGDGDSTVTPMVGSSPSVADVYHTYTLPGTYTVRHILCLGMTPVDTVEFDHNYKYCRVLPVMYYNDANGNCSKESTEVMNPLPISIRIDSNSVPIDTMVITGGLYYKALGGPGTIYAFRTIPASTGVTSFCSGGVIYDTIVTYTNTYAAKYLGLGCSGSSTFDLKVNATARTGRHSQEFNIQVANTTCMTMGGTLTLKFSPKYSYYPSYGPTFPAPTSAAGNTITWSLTGINAFSTKNISVHLERMSPLPWLIPGDTVNSTITITPTTGDIDTTNNTLVRIDTVKTSFDPNDIAVAPAGYILPCTWLEYRVRFENTGNDTAHNIHVLDTLPVAVDPSTLMAVSSSHAMNMALINDGVRTIAKFDFPNINLLDSSHHNLCNGMVIFRVKARTTLTDGTDIMNRVGIYFDDNEVVMTNQVNNTVGAAPIDGPDHVCLGYPDTMVNSMVGGVWASSTPATGTIATNGIVTGIAAGTTTLSYTVSNGCASRTATKVVTVSPMAAPTVSISTPDLTVCSGSPVIFNTVATHAGTTPTYIWRVDGTIVSSGSAYSYLPTTGDSVSVIMTSSEACTMPNVVGDTVVMTVLTTGLPVLLISVAPNDTTCATVPATFNTSAIYGGSAPGFQWYVNSILSATGPTYTYAPANGDVVRCRMGSSYQCRTADTVVSSTINMTVDPLYMPVISISAIPGLTVNAGDPITFVANVLGGGPTPIFEWYVNTTPVAGVTTGTFTTTTLSDYDSVTCKVTGSGVCAITSFNSVYVTILPAGVSHVTGDADVSIFPNPNTGAFRVRANVGAAMAGDVTITVNDMLGRAVYNTTVAPKRGGIDATVQLPADLANGTYMLGLRYSDKLKVFRFVVDR